MTCLYRTTDTACIGFGQVHQYPILHGHASSRYDSDFLFILGGIGCFFSSSITLLVCRLIHRLSDFFDVSVYQIFFPRDITNEIGYQVKPRSPTPNSRPPSHYTFPQPMSPKSPVSFVQYHKRHRREYPSIEVECGFPPTASRFRTRQDRHFRSLDFGLGLQEDTMSSYSEAPSYHQYPEEDQWEDRGRERRREREHTNADIEAISGTMYEDGPQLPMTMLEARPWRGERANPPPRPVTNLHPYVGAPALTRRDLRTNFRNRRLLLSLLPLVSHKSNERDKF